MPYTVKQLADLAGVSVRTLHYYDQIGLLKPSTVAPNGYRSYEDEELMKLQQILFFRELDFPLEKIIKMMGSKNYSTLGALYDQRRLLELKTERFKRLLKTVNKTIYSLENNTPMNQDDTFSAFNDPDYKKYQAEAEQRWGHTDAYKQSQERLKKMTKAELDTIKADGEALTKKLADLFVSGVTPKDDRTQALIEEHYNAIKHFYEPHYAMYKNMGQMYVDDPRFTAYYDKHAKGLAVFMRDAIAYFADERLSA